MMSGFEDFVIGVLAWIGTFVVVIVFAAGVVNIVDKVQDNQACECAIPTTTE